MNTDLISIIVPIYNVEKYLRDCIESILNQTYGNIEVILVDDGSPDLCPQICDEYRNRDQRVIVIHKENGGLSAARNCGLEIAKGKYLTFVDADDCLFSNFIEELYNAVCRTNSDVAICDYKVIADSYHEHYPLISNGNGESVVYSNVDCIKSMYVPKIHGMEFVAWGKLYDRSLFLDNNIRYPVGKIHEDTFTTYKLIYYSKQIVFISKELYMYRHREGSIMQIKYNIKRLSVIEATRETCYFFSKEKEQELFDCALNAHFKTLLNCHKSLIENYNEDDKKSICASIRKVYFDDLKTLLPKSKLFILKKVYYRLRSFEMLL